MRRSTKRNKRTGFTLIEVLLVLAILGAIMSMVVPKMLGRQNHANIDTTRVSLRGVEQALRLYALDHNGVYPAGNDGLSLLVQPPGSRDRRWKGPYLDREPVDAWGNSISYISPGKINTGGFDIVSPGPDQVLGTEDDIGNWDM